MNNNVNSENLVLAWEEAEVSTEVPLMMEISCPVALYAES
jgi:hypothetical protein